MPANIPYPSIKDGDDFTVTPLMANILAILAAIQSFDGSQIQVGTVAEAALATGLSSLARDYDILQSFVASGLVPSGYTGFTLTIPNGIAYVSYNSKLTRYAVTGSSYTVTASKDTYFSLKNDGTIDVPSALANNAALPTLATGSQFLIRVVSDGTGIQRIDDLRNLNPLKSSTITDGNSWKVRQRGGFKTYHKSFAVNSLAVPSGNRSNVATTQALPIGVTDVTKVTVGISYRGSFAGHAVPGLDCNTATPDTTFSIVLANQYAFGSLTFTGFIDVMLTDV